MSSADCTARANALIEEALGRRRPAWIGERFAKPPEILRRQTGVDVLADWRLPGSIDPHAAETAICVLLASVRKRDRLCGALVEAFALENGPAFADLALRITSRPAAELDPMEIAMGMLSGLPAPCIADWVSLGPAPGRTAAYHRRKLRIQTLIGFPVQWVASDETMDEITRQHAAQKGRARAIRETQRT